MGPAFRSKLMFILILAGIVGLTIEFLYFNHFFDNFYILMFIATISVASPLLFVALFVEKDTRILAFLVLLCAIFVHGMYYLYATDFSYIPPRDALFHGQVVEQIIKGSHIPFGTGFDVKNPGYAYSYFPAMHSIIAMLSLITTIDFVTVVKLFPFVFCLLPIGIYIFSLRVFKSKRISALAAFTFNFLPGELLATKYRFLALIFVLLFFYSYISFLDKAKPHVARAYAVCACIFIFSLSMSHHVTLYVTLGLVLLLFAFDRIPFAFSNFKKRVRLSTTLLLFTIGCFWIIFVALTIYAQHVHQFVDWFILAPVTEQRITYTYMRGYTQFEQLFNMATISATFFLGLIGFLRYLKSEKSERDKHFLTIVLYFGALFVGFYAFSGVNETVENIARRMWAFILIGLSPLVSYCLTKIKLNVRIIGSRRALKALGLVILLCWSLTSMDLMKGSFDYDFEKKSGVASKMWGYGEKIIASVRWFDLTTNKSAIAVGDSPIHDFGTSLNHRVIFYWSVYNNTSQREQDLMTLKDMGAKYIFVNHLMSIYDQEPSWRIYVETVPEYNLVSLTHFDALSAVYDNGFVQVLFISE